MTDDYIFSKMRRIRGYLDPGDALVVSTLMADQAERGIRGSAVQIGIDHGRGFYLIDRHLQAGERALAVDVFAPEAEGPAQLELFLDAGRRIGRIVRRNEVLQADSAALMPSDILSRTRAPVRFFSIEGGHGHDHVRKDAELACACMARQGILVFDDFFNREWPEDSAAILDFLRARWDDLRPFAVTQRKLYVAAPAAGRAYAEALRSARAVRSLPQAPVNFFGHTAVWLQHRFWQRIGYEVLSRAGLGPVSALLY